MELDLELDLIEHEPTVLEYARFHGLCSDFTLELSQCHKGVSISHEIFHMGFQDPQGAPLITNPAEELTKERLAVTKEAAMLLLKSTQSLAAAPHDLLPITSGRKRIIDLKQEVPILRSDNELDLLEFGSVVEPNFTDLKIPLEPIDDENDEGLEWPSKCLELPARCIQRAKGEKLEVSRDTLVYLQDALRDGHSPEDVENIKREALFHRTVSDVQRYSAITEMSRTPRFNQSPRLCYH